jgi:hypothetical protein
MLGTDDDNNNGVDSKNDNDNDKDEIRKSSSNNNNMAKVICSRTKYVRLWCCLARLASWLYQ